MLCGVCVKIGTALGIVFRVNFKPDEIQPRIIGGLAAVAAAEVGIKDFIAGMTEQAENPVV